MAGKADQKRARLGVGLLGALLCVAPCACAPVESKADAATPAVACDTPGAIGTSRTLILHPHQHVGALPYSALPLQPKEIVLTFDDGPNPASTPAILKTLHDNCVLATFFPIGSVAEANPELLADVIAAGHSVGGHTFNHENLAAMPIDAAEDAAREGFAAIIAAGQAPRLFRFPGLADSAALLGWADTQDLAVVGVDMDPTDWAGDPPAATLARLKKLIVARGRGIVLLHDSQPNTAAFLPELLTWLREEGYRVVHVAAARPALSIGAIDPVRTAP